MVLLLKPRYTVHLTMQSGGGGAQPRASGSGRRVSTTIVMRLHFSAGILI